MDSQSMSLEQVPKKKRRRRTRKMRKIPSLTDQIRKDHPYATIIEDEDEMVLKQEDFLTEALSMNIRNNFFNLVSSAVFSKMITEPNNPKTPDDSFAEVENNDENQTFSDNGTENISVKQEVEEVKMEIVEHNVIETYVEELCLLCAAKNPPDESKIIIIDFAKVIMDFAGVDILKYSPSPSACANCFELILNLQNFKQQIIEADRFIQEKITEKANSMEHQSDSISNFVYIKCEEQNTNTVVKQEEFNEAFDDPTGMAELDSKASSFKIVSVEKLLRKKEKPVRRKPNLYNNKIKKCYLNHCKLKPKPKPQLIKDAESYVCDVCGKLYKHFDSFRRHEIIHRAKKYICNVCNDAFHYKRYLIRHMRRHTGFRPYSCPYCDKCFSTKWTLTQHRTIHTNILPYKCKYCSEAFRLNVTLKRHVTRTHTADECARTHSKENVIAVSSDSVINNENLNNSSVRTSCDSMESCKKSNNSEGAGESAMLNDAVEYTPIIKVVDTKTILETGKI